MQTYSPKSRANHQRVFVLIILFVGSETEIMKELFGDIFPLVEGNIQATR